MGALFDQICAYPTLLLAFDRVEENAGGPGADGVRIEDLAGHLTEALHSLRTSLLDGTYVPLPLLRVHVDKGGGKTRALSIPAVRDRIVQTAAAIVLTPILDKEFEACSFAYRKGRSVQQAIQRIIAYREQGYQWVVDADIQSFFDEIDHALLLAELGRLVSDQPVMELIKGWLQAELVKDDRRWRLTKGVPQGSPISPLLSNLYLDRFDEALLGAGHKLVRFADDFVILCKDRPQAEDALELTEGVLDGLRLQLNPEKTQIVDFSRGFRYLGVQFIRSLAFCPLYPEQPAPEDQPTTARTSMRRTGARHPLAHPLTIAKPAETPGARPPAAEPSSGKTVPDTTMGRALEAALAVLPAEEADEVWEGLLSGEDSGPVVEPSAGHAPLLRTLYLVEQGAILAKTDERFVVTKGGETLREIPAIKVEQIMVFGNIQITTPAMKFCLMERIPVILLSSRGRYFGTLESSSADNVALHRDQFARAADPAFSLHLAKAIVRGKIGNAKTVLQRYARHRPGTVLAAQLATLKTVLHHLPSAQTLEEVRGYEGAAAAQFFSALRVLIGEGWGFERRQKQPPPDPVNSLLSLGYTLLFYNLYALVRAHGLHPGVGYLHPLHQGHPALVSDLMEEFRAPVVDALVLHLLFQKRVSPADFVRPSAQGLPCLLNDQARKLFIGAFEDKMNSPITHSKTGFRVDYRRCLDFQVQAMARCIRHPGTDYEPMTIR